MDISFGSYLLISCCWSSQLQLEDPSLVVEDDEDSGQTMMRGMGELHLDVMKVQSSAIYSA